MWKWRPVEVAWFPGPYNHLHAWSCESPLTSPGHASSHFCCNNNRLCLITTKVRRRRGIRSVGVPTAPCPGEGPMGREGWFPATQKSLFSFGGSSYTQQTSVWVNKTRWTHLGDLRAQAQVLAPSYGEVRRACRFLKERGRDHPPIMQQILLHSWIKGMKSDVFQAQNKAVENPPPFSLHKEHLTHCI